MRSLVFLGSPGRNGIRWHISHLPLLDRWFDNIHNDTIGSAGIGSAGAVRMPSEVAQSTDSTSAPRRLEIENESMRWRANPCPDSVIP